MFNGVFLIAARRMHFYSFS